MLLCVVLICKEGIGVIGVCLRRFCLTGCSGECCFRVMYCEWYGVCDFVVLLVFEVCADYVGVDVFHVCLNFFLRLLWCWGLCQCLCCDFCLICDACSWRCSFMGSMFVSSCICCVFVSVVHPVAILSAVFCVICSLVMFVSDAIGDHMVEAYSSMGLVMALYVAMIVSFCLPHVVDVSALSIFIVLSAFVVVIYMCL